MATIPVWDFETEELVGTVSDDTGSVVIETSEDEGVLRGEIEDLLGEDGHLQYVVPVYSEAGAVAYNEVLIPPGDERFISALVDLLPSPFHVTDETLSELPDVTWEEQELPEGIDEGAPVPGEEPEDQAAEEKSLADHAYDLLTGDEDEGAE